MHNIMIIIKLAKYVLILEEEQKWLNIVIKKNLAGFEKVYKCTYFSLNKINKNIINHDVSF